jgi:hypothetical protein
LEISISSVVNPDNSSLSVFPEKDEKMFSHLLNQNEGFFRICVDPSIRRVNANLVDRRIANKEFHCKRLRRRLELYPTAKAALFNLEESPV